MSESLTHHICEAQDPANLHILLNRVMPQNLSPATFRKYKLFLFARGHYYAIDLQATVLIPVCKRLLPQPLSLNVSTTQIQIIACPRMPAWHRYSDSTGPRFLSAMSSLISLSLQISVSHQFSFQVRVNDCRLVMILIKSHLRWFVNRIIFHIGLCPWALEYHGFSYKVMSTYSSMARILR